MNTAEELAWRKRKLDLEEAVTSALPRDEFTFSGTESRSSGQNHRYEILVTPTKPGWTGRLRVRIDSHRENRLRYWLSVGKDPQEAQTSHLIELEDWIAKGYFNFGPPYPKSARPVLAQVVPQWRTRLVLESRASEELANLPETLFGLEAADLLPDSSTEDAIRFLGAAEQFLVQATTEGNSDPQVDQALHRVREARRYLRDDMDHRELVWVVLFVWMAIAMAMGHSVGWLVASLTAAHKFSDLMIPLLADDTRDAAPE